MADYSKMMLPIGDYVNSSNQNDISIRISDCAIKLQKMALNDTIRVIINSKDLNDLETVENLQTTLRFVTFFEYDISNQSIDGGFKQTQTFFSKLTDILNYDPEKCTNCKLVLELTLKIMSNMLKLAYLNNAKNHLVDKNQKLVDNLIDLLFKNDFQFVENCLYYTLIGDSNTFTIENSNLSNLQTPTSLIIKLILIEYNQTFNEKEYIADEILRLLSQIELDSSKTIMIENCSIKISDVLKCLTKISEVIKLGSYENDVRSILYKTENFIQLINKFLIDDDEQLKLASLQLVIELMQNERILYEIVNSHKKFVQLKSKFDADREFYKLDELTETYRKFLKLLNVKTSDEGSSSTSFRYEFIDDVIESYDSITDQFETKRIRTYQTFSNGDKNSEYTRPIQIARKRLKKNKGNFANSRETQIFENIIKHRSPVNKEYLDFFIDYLYVKYDNNHKISNQQRLDNVTSLLCGRNVNLKNTKTNLALTYVANFLDKTIIEYNHALKEQLKIFFEEKVNEKKSSSDMFDDLDEKLDEKTEENIFYEHQLLEIKIRALLEIILNLKLQNLNDDFSKLKLNEMFNELLIALEQFDIYFYIKAIELINDKQVKRKFLKLLTNNVGIACDEFLNQNCEYSILSGWNEHLIVASIFNQNNQLYIRFDNGGEGSENHENENKKIYPFVMKIEKNQIEIIFEHLFNQLVGTSENSKKSQIFYSLKVKFPPLRLNEIKKNFKFEPVSEQINETCVFYSLNAAFKNRILNRQQSIDFFRDVISTEFNFTSEVALNVAIGNTSLSMDFLKLYDDLIPQTEMCLTHQWMDRNLRSHYKSDYYSKVKLIFDSSRFINVNTFKLCLINICDVNKLKKPKLPKLLSIDSFKIFTSNEILNLFRFENTLQLKPKCNILINGESGAGKSHLVKCLANQFGIDKQRPSMFYCVILIKLCTLNESFLRNYCENQSNKDVELFSTNLINLNDNEKSLLKCTLEYRDNILWIFDGYSELSNDLIQNYPKEIAQLLNRKYSILTSRTDKQPCGLDFDYQLQMLGFSDNQVTHFYQFYTNRQHIFNLDDAILERIAANFQNIYEKITTILSSNSNISNPEEFMTFLKSKIFDFKNKYKNIYVKKSQFKLMRAYFCHGVDYIIPIYVELFCFIFSKQTLCDDMIINRTKFFQMMAIIKKKLWLNEEFKLAELTLKLADFDDKNFRSIERKCKVQSDALEYIAYSMIERKISSITCVDLKLLINESENDDGLFDEIINLGFLEFRNGHYTFIHQSFMKYFYALHLTKIDYQQFLNEKSNEIETIMFIVGIFNNKKDIDSIKKLFEVISTKTVVKGEAYYGQLVHFMTELVDVQILESVLDIIDLNKTICCSWSTKLNIISIMEKTNCVWEPTNFKLIEILQSLFINIDLHTSEYNSNNSTKNVDLLKMDFYFFSSLFSNRSEKYVCKLLGLHDNPDICLRYLIFNVILMYDLLGLSHVDTVRKIFRLNAFSTEYEDTFNHDGSCDFNSFLKKLTDKVISNLSIQNVELKIDLIVAKDFEKFKSIILDTFEGGNNLIDEQCKLNLMSISLYVHLNRITVCRYEREIVFLDDSKPILTLEIKESNKNYINSLLDFIIKIIETIKEFIFEQAQLVCLKFIREQHIFDNLENFEERMLESFW